MKRPARLTRFALQTSTRLLLCGLFWAASALADATPGPEPANPEGSRGEAAAGLRAYVDPDTGELTSVPSPEQVEALSKSLEKGSNRSTEGLEAFKLRQGGRGVYLAGRFKSALVVTLADGGGFTLSCVDGPEHAHEAPEAQPSESPAQAPRTMEWVER